MFCRKCQNHIRITMRHETRHRKENRCGLARWGQRGQFKRRRNGCKLLKLLSSRRTGACDQKQKHEQRPSKHELTSPVVMNAGWNEAMVLLLVVFNSPRKIFL